MKTLMYLVMAALSAVPAGAVVTNITSGGGLYGTIQAAVNAANNGDTLLVTTGLYNERVVISQKSLNLRGGYWANFVTRTNVAALTCINAGGSGSALTVLSNCTVVLERLMLTNGVNFFGGGIRMNVGVTVTADTCAVNQNMGGFGGGGLVVEYSSSVVMVNTEVRQNRAAAGGGILAMGETARVELRGGNTDIRDNYATDGGGIFVEGGEVLVAGGADVFGNVAVLQGGGIFLTKGARGVVSGNGSVIGTSFANRATNNVAEGGGVYVKDAVLVVENNAQFGANHATARGGGIYVTNGSVTVRGNAVIGYEGGTVSNYALLGGGLYAVDSVVTISNGARMVHGHAMYGGGVYLMNSTGVFEGCQVRQNVATTGGGIYARQTSAVTMASCVLASNVAAQVAGVACWYIPAPVSISNTVFMDNHAQIVGGLYAVDCPNMEINGGSRFEQNRATQVGGMFAGNCGPLRMRDVAVVSNVAVQYAGVLLNGCPGFDVADCDFIGNAATGSIYGALTIVNTYGSVRTRARPASMVGNYAAGGGAIVVEPSSMVNVSAPEYPLQIVSNSAPEMGGGVWLRDYATATVAGAVYFIGNMSSWGGAIMATNHAVLTLLPTNGLAPVFSGNAAAYNGGAINMVTTARVHAVNCTFRGNTAGSFGGAIRNSQSYLLITPDFGQAGDAPPSVFADNSAIYGGAIHSYHAPQTLIDSALIISNSATTTGGGVRMFSGSSAQLINNVIAHNRSAEGGGVAVDMSSLAHMRHCTVAGNTSNGVYSAGGALVLTNCVVWGNTLGQISAGHTVHFCDVEGGYAGGGNINTDPLFMNAAELNYALGHGSPCVNAGTAAGVTWDCTGAPRPMGSGYDMGAYEQDPAPVQVVTPTLLDFGDVVVGESAALPVTVINSGNSLLSGTVQFVPAPIFTADPSAYSVPAQESSNVTVTFSPLVEYHWTQTIVFSSNGGSTNVTLIGTGIPEPSFMVFIGVIGALRLIRRLMAAQ